MFLQNIRKEIVLRPGCEEICWGLNRKILNVHHKIFVWHRKLKPLYPATSQTKEAHNTHLCSRAFDKIEEEEEAEKVLWLGSNSWCVRPAHPAQVRRETVEVEGKKFPLFLQQEATLRRNWSSSSTKMAPWDLLCPQNPSNKMAQVYFYISFFYFFYNWSRWLPVGQNL